jgi:prolipoprotein diacylglyceryltransferase
VILWVIRKKIKISGLLFCFYLIMNGIERFFIEKIRVNTEYNIFGGITQAEIISFILITIGSVFTVILIKRNKLTNFKL